MEKRIQEQDEELKVLEEFEASLEGFEVEEVLDPLADFPKECICGGQILPIHDDNPHFGSYCTKCE